MMVVDEMEIIAPRKMLSMALQPKKRPIWQPTPTMNRISSAAVINAVPPTRLSLRKLNSNPNENMSRITPSSASVLMVFSFWRMVEAGQKHHVVVFN